MLRTITGKIGKISPDKFQVKTKTATMGIRGTRFTLLAPPAGPMQAFCSLGAIVIGIPLSGDSLGQESGSGHTPITLPQGSTVSVLPSGKFTKVQKFTAADLDKALKENFATPQKKKTTAKKTTQKTKKKKVAEKPNAKKKTKTSSKLNEKESDQTKNTNPNPLSTSNPTDGSAHSQQELTATDTGASGLPDSIGMLQEVGGEVGAENILAVVQEVTAEASNSIQVTETEETLPTEPEPEPTTPEPEPEPTTPEPEPEPTTPDPEPTTPEPEPEPTTPEPEPEPTPGGGGGATPTVTFTFSGKATAYRHNNVGYSTYLHNLPHLSSDATIKATSSTTFDTSASFIEITEYTPSNGTANTWKFIPASTMTYTSENVFSGSFASITASDTAITTGVITAGENSFEATNDDLSTSDAMSWGKWNIKFAYTKSGQAKTGEFSGLWVGGKDVTSSATINGYTSTTPITYDGKYKANLFSTTAQASVATPSTGTASLVVNFGTDKATLNLGAGSGGVISATTYTDMPISGNSFSITNATTKNSANGTFYGSEGKSAAGSFSVWNGSTITPVAEGVYQVTTTQTPQ